MSDKPNILMIMTDQQRYDSLGCYGGKAVDTPNLDKLAREGALFEQCYVNSTVCTPSRASIMTGKPLPGHGVYKLHDLLPHDQILFPALLQQAGYQTALFGKLHVSGRMEEAVQRHPHDGFDRYEWCVDPGLHLDSPFNAYAKWLLEHHPDLHARQTGGGSRIGGHVPAEAHMTHWAAERTIGFIRDRHRDQPFFCLMSVFDPHDPYDDYPPGYDSLVNQIDAPEPPPQDAEELPDGIKREMRRYAGRINDGVSDIRRGYYASIGFLDREIGRVLEELDRQGLRDNTLVLFVSDHGDMLGDRGLLMKGAYFYEACVKVPLIARWPERIPGHTTISQFVQPHDLAATILLAAGMSEDDIQSRMPHAQDLTRLAVGDITGRKHAVCMYRNTGYGEGGKYWDPPIHCTMYREGNFKMNMFHRPSDDETDNEGELFDLQADVGETVNLWRDPDYTATRHRLTDSLMNWITSTDVAYNGSRGGERLVDTMR